MKKLVLFVAAVLFGGIVTAMAAQPLFNGPPGVPIIGSHHDDAAIKMSGLIYVASTFKADDVMPSKQMKTLVPSNTKMLSVSKVIAVQMKKNTAVDSKMLFPTTKIHSSTAGMNIALSGDIGAGATMLPSHVPRQGALQTALSTLETVLIM